MIPRQNPSHELLRLAALQSGMLTAEQAHGLGLGRTAIERLCGPDGPWSRVATGLYSIEAPPLSWEGRAWGGVLLGGDGARLGEHAAGHVWGLVPEPSEVMVWVPLGRTRTSRDGWRFARERPGYRERSRQSPPCTTVEDTVLDICAVSEPGEVIDLVSRSVQNRSTRTRRLLRRLEQRGRLRHSRLIRELVTDVAEGAETPLELHYLHDVERAHGLPHGERQSGAAGAVCDVRYRAYGVVVELDGRLGHEGMDRFRDMRRDNRTTMRGEITLRYGWVDVRSNPCAIAWQVASLLSRQGWPGLPSRCSHCRHAPDEDLSVA